MELAFIVVVILGSEKEGKNVAHLVGLLQVSTEEIRLEEERHLKSSRMRK